MPDAFLMRWKLDRPYLEANTPGDVYALLTIEPNPAVLGTAPAAPIPSHLILLVDVSESMDVLVRHDPNAQKVGAGSAEGKAAQRSRLRCAEPARDGVQRRAEDGRTAARR